MKKRIKYLIMLCVLSVVVLATPALAAKKSTGAKFSLQPSTVAPTRKSVKVTVKLNKGTKVKEIVWKKGKTTKSASKYWKKAKNVTKAKKFSASANGWYSVRVKNKNNKYTIRNIQVNCIDKQCPSGQAACSVANKVATVSIAASDSNGITFIGFAKGYLNVTNATSYTALPVASPAFTTAEPGYYTICIKDGVGNISLIYQYVELWKDLWNWPIFDKDEAGPCERTIYDRWNNTYVNPVGLGCDKSGKLYLEYCLNGAYKNFSGTIVRGKGIEDEDTVWIEILADDIVVYSSSKMDYKSRPIPFDVSISNARYIKIRAYSLNRSYYYHWNSSDSEGIYITDGKLYN